MPSQGVGSEPWRLAVDRGPEGRERRVPPDVSSTMTPLEDKQAWPAAHNRTLLYPARPGVLPGGMFEP